MPHSKGYIYGIYVANSGTHSIVISPGEATSDDVNPVVMALPAPIIKGLGAVWAEGAEGGLDAGSKDNSTWYYVWLIHRSDIGHTDAILSVSCSSPTIPEGYDHKRLVWAVKTDGAGNIHAFIQVGDLCLWLNPITEVAATSVTAVTTFTIGSVPPLLGVVAELSAFLYNPVSAGAARVFSGLISSCPYNIAAASAGSFGACDIAVHVNGSGQIKSQNSVGTNQLTVYGRGFRFPS